MSKAIRTHRQLTELAEAIYAAPVGEPETYSLEWKSSLDLAGGAASPRFKVAKPVIAFANRNPDAALREFEGCAYILVGVEPQNVIGIPKHDPADMDSWLTPYLGTQGPHWSIDYVRVGGHDVLIVTVEPPRWGDRILVLEKTFEGFQAGRPFIRRQGKSVEPSPNELRMLEERIKRAGSRLQLVVGFTPGQSQKLFAYDIARDDWQQWVRAEQQALYGPLSPRPAELGVHISTDVLERRSREQYQQDIEAYLDKDTWQALIWEDVADKELAPLRLQIENPTELNFAAVEIELDLPEAVYAFFTSEEPRHVLDAPERPAPWGEDTIASPDLRAAGRAIRSKLGLEPGRIAAGPGPWKVQFEPVDLRPRKTVPLPELFLAIPDGLHQGDERTLALHWTATSKSAHDNVKGSLTVSLAPGSIHVTAVVMPHA